MRERGSNTARPTEKGGGGLQIGARPVGFGAIRRVGRADFVAICGLPLGVSCRQSRRHPADNRRQDTKKPDSSIVESGLSYRSKRSVRSCASRRFGVLLVSRRVDSVDFGASVVPIRSRFGASVVPISARFGASVVPISARFRRVGRADTKDKAQTQKKPDSSIGGSGSTIARRRALLTFG